ncbi:MAG: hypothetical protein JOZ24_01760 [Candidatus Eremiobacteraeota bacterium]|nr:hypothetical protein [Candidatus Eremiobacteraeota bacterium]
MQSSPAQLINAQRRSALFLSAVVLAALAGSLLLAFIAGRAIPTWSGAAPQAAPTIAARAAPSAPSDEDAGPPSLLTLLEPWAYRIDAIAFVGLGLVLTLARAAQRAEEIP